VLVVVVGVARHASGNVGRNSNASESTRMIAPHPQAVRTLRTLEGHGFVPLALRVLLRPHQREEVTDTRDPSPELVLNNPKV